MSRRTVELPEKLYPETLLSIKQVVKLINLDRATFYKIRKSGQGPKSVEIGNKTDMFTYKSIVEWLGRGTPDSD